MLFTTMRSRSKPRSSRLCLRPHFANSFSGTRRSASPLPLRKWTVTTTKLKLRVRNDAMYGARHHVKLGSYRPCYFLMRSGSASAASPVNRKDICHPLLVGRPVSAIVRNHEVPRWRQQVRHPQQVAQIASHLGQCYEVAAPNHLGDVVQGPRQAWPAAELANVPTRETHRLVENVIAAELLSFGGVVYSPTEPCS